MTPPKAKYSDSETKTAEPEKPESPEQLEERAVQYVLKCRDDSKQFYSEKFKQFAYFDRLYIKGAAKTNVPYGRANLKLPLAFQQVEPFVSQMTETMVGEPNYLVYEGRTVDDSPTAEQITDFTQYQLDEGGFITAYVQYLRNLGKYGTAVMKVPWETETVDVDEEVDVPTFTMTELGPVQVGVSKQVQTREEVLHDGPVFLNLPIYDFLVPKSATSCNVQKMDWVIHRCYRSLEDLLSNPNYKSKHKQILNLIRRRDNPEDVTGAYGGGNARTKSDDPNEDKKAKKFSGKVELLEYWGLFNLQKGQGLIPCLLTVADLDGETLCLRCDTNPNKYKFKPFLMSNVYPIEGEPYGYGVLHHIEGLVEESTALRNARLDIANLSLNRPWLVERQAGLNPRELYLAPNHVIFTNNNEGVRQLELGGVTPSSVQEIARIDFDIQNTTEIINPRQDVSNMGPAFGGTATGVSFLAAKSNLRMLTQARLQEETFFKPLAKMLNWYNQDLVTDEVYFRTYDDQNPYSTISPDAFLTAVDYKPTSNPQKLSLAERRDNMSYLLQVVAQIEKVKPGTNRLNKLLKEVYRITGFNHPEEYVNPEVTVVGQTPDGQFVDQQGQPVQVIPLQPPGAEGMAA